MKKKIAHSLEWYTSKRKEIDMSDYPICACCQEEITGEVFTSDEGLAVCSHDCADALKNTMSDEEMGEDYKRRYDKLIRTIQWMLKDT